MGRSRGLVALAIAYALIVKVVFASAIAGVMVPGSDPWSALCLTDVGTHAPFPDHPGSHGAEVCDDCTLSRVVGVLGPVPDDSVSTVQPLQRRVHGIVWRQDQRHGISPAAWWHGRAQRGPPAS
ncbi:hypothetical protein [uncultured Alsobacter sp.]|uniref:hypothetical protein n=1 Tax=uncultured Alsobacter sp. TaxID=1748258 RepID=UPI0025FC4F4E|nr:hypothetical protein [uncultured Alsobacter sp.]